MRHKFKKFAISFLLFDLFFFLFSSTGVAISVKGYGNLDLQARKRNWQVTFAAHITPFRASFEILDDFGNSLLFSSGELNEKMLRKFGFKIDSEQLASLILYQQTNNLIEFDPPDNNGVVSAIPLSKKQKWVARLSDFRKPTQTDKQLAKMSNQDKNQLLPYRLEIKSKKASLIFSWHELETIQ